MNEKEYNVPLEELVVFALSQRKRFYTFFDQIHRQYGCPYGTSHCESKLNIYKGYTLRTEDVIHKLFGLLYSCPSAERAEELFVSLIKRAYKKTYLLVKNAEYVDADSLIRLAVKENVGVGSVIIIGYYLCMHFGIECEEECMTSLINEDLTETAEFDARRLLRKSDELIRHEPGKVKEINNKYYFPMVNNAASIAELIDADMTKMAEAYHDRHNKQPIRQPDIPEIKDIVQQEIKNFHIKNNDLIALKDRWPLQPESIDAEDMSSSILKEPKYRALQIYSSYLEFLNIRAPEWVDKKVKNLRKEMQRLSAISEEIFDTFELSESERYLFAMSAVFLYAISSECMETQAALVKESRKDSSDRLKAYKESLKREQEETKQKKQDFISLSKQLEAKEKHYMDQIDALREELRAANKQCEQYKQEKEAYQEGKKELVALRNYVYKNRREESNEEQMVPVEKMIQRLSRYKAIFFGGHPNFTNKLKSRLPFFEFRETELLGRDVGVIQNKDYVFVETNHLNHAMYAQIISEVNKSDSSRLVYLSGYTNTELAIKEMYEATL